MKTITFKFKYTLLLAVLFIGNFIYANGPQQAPPQPMSKPGGTGDADRDANPIDMYEWYLLAIVAILFIGYFFYMKRKNQLAKIA